MLDASRATSPALESSTLVDFEGLLPVPQEVPPKKTPLFSGFPWLTGVVRRFPFLSAVFLYGVLTGIIAGVAKSSYNRDKRRPGAKFAYHGNGVSFSLLSPALVGFELPRHIIDCNPRTWLSDRCFQRNPVDRVDGLGVWGIWTTLL